MADPRYLLTNAAVAAESALIGSVQAGRVPRQAPDQREKRQPAAATARSETARYEVTGRLHRRAQRDDAVELATLPRPSTATVSR